MKINNRLNNITEYHFKKIDDIKQKLLEQGKKIYDFGIGDPDLNVHEKITDALVKALKYEQFNKYPPYDGIKELKEEIIRYYKEVYNVYIEKDEVIILIGSKEGLSNIIPAVCNFGDTAIITNPAYPVYGTCASLWGVETYKLALSEKDYYLPVLEYIPEEVAVKSKLFIINYPNNPTGAVANIELYRRLVDFCQYNNMVLCNDAAYNEIVKSAEEPISILQAGRKNCIEFGSFSKTFNMTGFRIGYAVGDREVIKALLKIKSNMDSGQFTPIQHAAIEALRMDRSIIYKSRAIYDDRRNVVEAFLKNKNFNYFKPGGAFYVWVKIPRNYTTDEFCEVLLEKYGIIVTPGYTFGNVGHGYFRIALTQSIEVIQEGFDKLEVNT
jgi:LL-diaminopimelate aminotransferase